MFHSIWAPINEGEGEKRPGNEMRRRFCNGYEPSTASTAVSAFIIGYDPIGKIPLYVRNFILAAIQPKQRVKNAKNNSRTDGGSFRGSLTPDGRVNGA
jgi:hypothetical protein